MDCLRDHLITDLIITNIPIDQSGFGRHKCASCAYEEGLKNGKDRVLNFNLEKFIAALPYSQKGLRRHRSPTEAYTLGFFHGLSGTDSHNIIKNKLKMAAQMRHFGLHMISKGVVNATNSENENPYSHALGVVQVANGFEILIKSKIVEEHPLLIFSKIPTDNNVKGDKMETEDLLEHGQTIMYSELPDRLWATTGYKIADLRQYKEFGKIRNQIIHFSVPEISLSDQILKFTFEVIEKSINEWFDTSILVSVSEIDPLYLEKITSQFKRLKIKLAYQLDENGELIKI